MDAKDYVVNEVLRDPRRFMVPIYQRQYQWGRKRLEPLWDDIVAKADEVLEGNARFMHYMGALILAPTGDADKFATTPSIQVVDGQQRLTSFQLFLAALREQALTLGVEDAGPAVREYLFNEPKSKDTDPHTRFKLSPTPSDRKLFWTLMEEGMAGAKELHPELFYKNGNLIYGQAPPALAAYYYFLDCVRTYALWGVGRRDSETGADAADPDMAAERIDALLKAVLTRMKLVVIALGEADDGLHTGSGCSDRLRGNRSGASAERVARIGPGDEQPQPARMYAVVDGEERYLFSCNRARGHLSFYIRLDALELWPNLAAQAAAHFIETREQGGQTIVVLRDTAEAEKLIEWLLAECEWERP